MIQIFPKKKTLFFLFIFNLLIFNTKIHAQGIYHHPDSLFEQKQYLAACKAYHQIFEQTQMASTQALLKMSMAGEISGQHAYTLFALLYLRQFQYPKADDKLAQITKLHNLQGYKYSDDQFFVHFLRRNFFIIAVLACAGAIGFALLAFLQKKSKRSATGLLVVSLLWVLFFVILLNSVSQSDYAISLENNVLVMDDPSHAAQVAAELKMGDRVRVKSRLGYWTAIDWQDQTHYVKTSLLLSSI